MEKGRLVSELASIVSENNVSAKADVLTTYGPDIAAVVYPTSTEQVSGVMEFAHKSGVAVTVYGGKSNFNRGMLPPAGGIALDMTRMKRVIQYEPDNQTITVEGGMTNAELQKLIAPDKLFFPPDPVDAGVSTIGGHVATNAAGPRRLKYGLTKDWVLGLEIVLANGDVIHAGGKCVKNVSGYEFTRFYTNSWGNMGIVTQATLRLRPVPEKERLLIIDFPSAEKAAAAAVAMIVKRVDPAAIELIDGELAAVAGNGHFTGKGASLLVAVDGVVEAVERQVKDIQEMARGNGADAARLVPEGPDTEVVWDTRRNAVSAFLKAHPGALVGQAAVLMNKGAEFVARASELASRKGVPVAFLGHAGSGVFQILFADPAKADGLFAGLRDLAASLEGTFLVENSAELDLFKAALSRRGQAVFPLLARIKAAVDPKNILNPSSKLNRIIAPEGSGCCAKER